MDSTNEDLEGSKDEGQIIVLLIPDEEYSRRILKITKEIANVCDNLCYVSLNLPYAPLINNFKKEGIDISKFYVIDGITQTAEIAKNRDGVEYVSSPGALTELSLAISHLLETRKFEYIIFDSLSTLLVYEASPTVTKFVHSLMAKIRVVGCKAIFTCLKQDSSSVLLKDVNMFSDRILDAEYWGRKN